MLTIKSEQELGIRFKKYLKLMVLSQDAFYVHSKTFVIDERCAVVITMYVFCHGEIIKITCQCCLYYVLQISLFL